MDIELLSKMVRELVLDHDEVGLPGLGTFIATVVPASFSDRGYTINPPYRKLSFTSEVKENDLLIEFYANMNSIDKEKSTLILTEFLEEQKNILLKAKAVVFPGLGRLRATMQNTFFFVTDADADIYPEGFGLEPISLKSHVVDDALPIPETQAEEQVQTASQTVQESIPQIEPQAGQEKMEKPEEKGRKKKRGGGHCFLLALLIVILVLVVASAAFMLLAMYAPDILDKLLYTKEELEILQW